MSSQIDAIFITEPQKRAYEKLGTKWVTAASIGEYLCVLYELHQKGLVELKMTKCKVLWRVPETEVVYYKGMVEN
jgi:hypothetical protein